MNVGLKHSCKISTPDVTLVSKGSSPIVLPARPGLHHAAANTLEGEGMSATSQHPPTLLATAAPSKSDQRLALFAILASIICFWLMAPFVRTALPRVPAFVPAYEAALAMSDLITGVILYGQFARLRRVSVLIVASAYLLCAFLVVAHILSFPGVFSPTGLLGAGPQTTAWLYVFWHTALPGLVLVYGLMAGSEWDIPPTRIPTGTATASAVALVIAVTAVCTLASTLGEAMLPVIIAGGDYSLMVQIGVSPAMLVLTGMAIAVLWRRRWTSVLDMWLFAVLWVWLCDVGLSAVIGSSRFDLGWYGGRLFGLLAATFVLGSLLVESSRLYGRLLEALAATERQNAELVRSRSELARTQRLEAVAELTGGVAHEFNNILTAIMGALDLIARAPDSRDKVVRLAGHGQAAATRGARLVRQLLTFARRQNLKPEVFNPNSVLLEFESLVSRAAGEAITLQFALDPAIYPVDVDATEFQAAILNLVTNARDAMKAGGSIRIESRNTDPGDSSGEFVLISVTDTGDGMAPETQAKAFEPFFTTKDVGASGLGLSQVIGFVESAGGRVLLQSELGAGTTVQLYLPRAPGHAAPSPRMTASVPLRHANSGESVLLVEDDPSVMTMTAQSLRDLGYAVLISASADAALDLLRGPAHVDILFSDVVMPGGMNGVQLAVQAARLRPELRVLLTSGYTGAALQAHDVPGNLPLLGKPYGRDELANKLRVVLEK